MFPAPPRAEARAKINRLMEDGLDEVSGMRISQL
jgi:hypothetical protein